MFKCAVSYFVGALNLSLYVLTGGAAQTGDRLSASAFSVGGNEETNE